MSYRNASHGPGLTKFLAAIDLGLCPGCQTHVTWVGVPIFRGMGVDLKRMKSCIFAEDHEEMKTAFADRQGFLKNGAG